MIQSEIDQVKIGSYVKYNGVLCKVFSAYIGDVQKGPHPKAKGPYFRMSEKADSAPIGPVSHQECEFVPADQQPA